MSDTVQAHQNYTDIHALNNLKQQAREDQRAALKPVAEQFEALFVEQIFKEARKVQLDDGWLDGNQGEFYKDWHDKQLAQSLSAKGTLGFADKIIEQLAPSIPSLNQATDSASANNALGAKENVNLTTVQALANRPNFE